MRKLFLLFALLLCMSGNGQTTIKWDYPVKPGSKEWKKLDSYSERLDKCQIPEEVLPHLDTPQLVDLCMEYPFLMNIYVFGDPFYGYDVLFHDFNGIRELFGREDAYECMGLPNIEYEESTIGGYVFGLLGREPKVGDKVEDNYCIYEVTDIDNMRITKVKAQVKEHNDEDEEL